MEFYNLKKLFLRIAQLFSPCLARCYYVVIKGFFKKLSYFRPMFHLWINQEVSFY